MDSNYSYLIFFIYRGHHTSQLDFGQVTEKGRGEICFMRMALPVPNLFDPFPPIGYSTSLIIGKIGKQIPSLGF